MIIIRMAIQSSTKSQPAGNRAEPCLENLHLSNFAKFEKLFHKPIEYARCWIGSHKYIKSDRELTNLKNHKSGY